MNEDSRVGTIIVILLLIGGGAGAWFWLKKPAPPPPPPVAATPPPAPAPAAPPDAGVPGARYPIDPASARGGGGPLPPLGESDATFDRALSELLGRKQVQSFFNVKRFANGFVATVDNMGRPGASAHLWPVKPTGGRFLTERSGGGIEIAPPNAERYAPLLRLVESVDTTTAVDLYVRLYPLFQQAYEELGYPGRYFNDRVVEVIDELAATPIPAGPVKLRRLAIPGAKEASEIYVFEDPSLEQLSAGQKVLLRVGPAHAERLKAKLAAVRAQLVDRSPKR